jgi:hypothetical protein
MSGDIPPFPLYAFKAWCLIKAWRQLYLYFLYLIHHINFEETLWHLISFYANYGSAITHTYPVVKDYGWRSESKYRKYDLSCCIKHLFCPTPCTEQIAYFVVVAGCLKLIGWRICGDQTPSSRMQSPWLSKRWPFQITTFGCTETRQSCTWLSE